ncbi:sugar transferase [Flavobacterium sp. 14A]|uniref:sugar transferase n=1 Tax=Flavobacterium sp. 14A TaxID=2735896 RepID=UPI00156EB4CE|nr:sugar transferase [Flavobacterium sp. 14A]NRT13283.1 hypothetical protein [Flavobacterium sp. 14A]
MHSLAPIVLFTFKRLDTLILTVEALQKSKLAIHSDLIVFSDAGRNEKEELAVAQVRNYIHTISGFRSVLINEAEQNKGLANSIIDGVTAILDKHKSVIVLEDDLISSSNFLDFMNKSLDYYQNSNKVMAVCGFSFPYKTKIEDDVYFLNRFWPWGWATWADRWEKADWTVADYSSFKNDKKRQKQFSYLGSDVNAMLKKQMDGKLDSWAIRWTYHIFKNKGIVLFPNSSKISNEGFDEFATNTVGLKDRYLTNIDTVNEVEFEFLKDCDINSVRQKEFLNKFSLKERIKNKVREILLVR